MCIAAFAAAPLGAQTPPSVSAPQSPPSVEATLAELRRLVERQQGLLEAQSKLLEGLSKEIAGLKKQVDDAGAVALTARNEVADLKKQPAAPTVPDAVAQRLAEVEKAVQRVPELTDVVAAGDFPGLDAYPRHGRRDEDRRTGADYGRPHARSARAPTTAS